MSSNKLINTKVTIVLILILTGFTSLKLNANQKEATSFPKVENLLILGAGSDIGANYKIGIFEKLRPLAQNIYLCEFENNTLARKLSDENLVDEVLFVKHCKDYKTLYESIKSTLQKKYIPVDAVVTYRDEWLEARSLLACDYNLPHQDVKAVSISRDKQKAREALQKNGLQCLRFEVGRLKNLERVCIDIGFPVFIKPKIGIRSEWGRRIDGIDDFKKYVTDVKKYPRISKGQFIVEEFLDGHEVDCDIVLWNGELLYAKTSDNFPVNHPFGLETGHLMPSILDANMQERISQYAYEAALTCGYDRGVLHVELMLRPNGGIDLIELNGRLGGMYIAKWHQEIWGADLIIAELAIALGITPTRWLTIPKKPNKSLAQLCITSNHDDAKYEDKEVEIIGWELKDKLSEENNQCYHVEKWVNFPYKSKTCVNGHPNLGELTVSASMPLEAFKKLYHVCVSTPIQVKTTIGVFNASYKPLLNFCSNTFNYERFRIEKATNNDKSSIQSLLPFLSSRTNQDRGALPDIPTSTIVLLAKDKMAPVDPIVGMISMHTWQRMRSKRPCTCYIHDLVTIPNYRNIGIAKQLINAAIEEANRLGAGKIDLACEQKIVNLYTHLGFSTVGVHLVKYLDSEKNGIDTFSKYNSHAYNNVDIQEKGEWIYGQDIVKEKIMPYDCDIAIPKHFFIPKFLPTIDPATIDQIYNARGSFLVKYSLSDSRAFSHQRKRGENSSRGRILEASKLSPREISQKIQNFADHAPESCAGVVLQEFIDQSGGCLFHTEMSKEAIDIDLLWENSTARAYARFTHKSLLEYEEIQGEGLPTNRKDACRRIHKKCEDIFNRLSKIHPEILSWAIEGFWRNRGEKFIVLQLRPTPQDKPVSKERDIKNVVYSTNFSWGDYETPSLEASNVLDKKYQGIFLQNDARYEIIDPSIVDRLTLGEQMLLIDPFRGFHLSHEKWFLPPPHLRNSFSFIHIPKRVLLSLKSKFKIISSGKKGYIVLVDE